MGVQLGLTEQHGHWLRLDGSSDDDGSDTAAASRPDGSGTGRVEEDSLSEEDQVCRRCRRRRNRPGLRRRRVRVGLPLYGRSSDRPGGPSSYDGDGEMELGGSRANGFVLARTELYRASRYVGGASAVAGPVALSSIVLNKHRCLTVDSRLTRLHCWTWTQLSEGSPTEVVGAPMAGCGSRGGSRHWHHQRRPRPHGPCDRR